MRSGSLKHAMRRLQGASIEISNAWDNMKSLIDTVLYINELASLAVSVPGEVHDNDLNHDLFDTVSVKVENGDGFSYDLNENVTIDIDSESTTDKGDTVDIIVTSVNGGSSNADFGGLYYFCFVFFCFVCVCVLCVLVEINIENCWFFF